MTRQEFLEELREALQGEISQAKINEHLRYYDNYIMEEARKGRTEQQVIEELGNPRLIAKTLVDTWDGSEEKAEGKPQGENPKQMAFKLKGWHVGLLLLVIVILLIVIVANVVAFLLPILIPVAVVLLVLSLVFGNKRQ